MIINVNKISEKGVSFNDIVDIDPNQLIEEESYFAEGVNYQIQFRRENNRIRARARSAPPSRWFASAAWNTSISRSIPASTSCSSRSR